MKSPISPHTQKALKNKRAQTLVEFALVFPLIVLLFLAFTQIVIYFQSATATELGTFYAARAFQVYGDRPLSDINYPHTKSHPHTNAAQTIAEAAAEKAIFESLLWEQKRIEVEGDYLSQARSYRDGNHASYNSGSLGGTSGAVHINYNGCGGEACENGRSIEIMYCLPIVFPGADTLFAGALKDYPCKGEALGRSYTGLAITRKAFLSREPIEQ